MAGQVIATRELSKRFGDVLAVDAVELDVQPGEIYGFLGLNGAGKTTTIRSILGMVRPTSGDVELFGRPLVSWGPAVWGRVGHLVEDATAYPELTVRQNLEVSRRLTQASHPGSVDRIIEMLALQPYADRRARTLSSGNMQRLGLARALLHEPDLLVLDEPTSGLDPAGVVEIRELLRSLASDRGVTVFMSSHILAEVDRLADRIGVIHEGRLIEELDSEELARRRRMWLSVDARDRDAAMAALRSASFEAAEDAHGIRLEEARAVERPDDVAKVLAEAGAPPTRLVVEQEDLEAHFLRLTSGDAAQEGSS